MCKELPQINKKKAKMKQKNWQKTETGTTCKRITKWSVNKNIDSSSLVISEMQNKTTVNNAIHLPHWQTF